MLGRGSLDIGARLLRRRVLLLQPLERRAYLLGRESRRRILERAAQTFEEAIDVKDVQSRG